MGTLFKRSYPLHKSDFFARLYVANDIAVVRRLMKGHKPGSSQISTAEHMQQLKQKAGLPTLLFPGYNKY